MSLLLALIGTPPAVEDPVFVLLLEEDEAEVVEELLAQWSSEFEPALIFVGSDIVEEDEEDAEVPRYWLAAFEPELVFPSVDLEDEESEGLPDFPAWVAAFDSDFIQDTIEAAEGDLDDEEEALRVVFQGFEDAEAVVFDLWSLNDYGFEEETDEDEAPPPVWFDFDAGAAVAETPHEVVFIVNVGRLLSKR